MYLTFASLIMSIFTSKFIGVETLGVIQTAFIGLMIVNYVQPVLAPLTQLVFINGPNNFFKQGSVQVDPLPNRVSNLQYESELAYSLNYSLAIVLIPLFIGLVLFLASKAVKTQEAKFKKFSLIAACEFGFTAAMFILFHFMIATLLFASYNQRKYSLFPISLAICLVTFVILMTIFVLFKRRPAFFGEFRTEFKTDQFCRNYYYFIIAGRVALCIILVTANTLDFVGFLALLVPITNIIVLSVKRPYKHLYNNIRAIFN